MTSIPIAEFCRRHQLSRGSYYNMKQRVKAPPSCALACASSASQRGRSQLARGASVVNQQSEHAPMTQELAIKPNALTINPTNQIDPYKAVADEGGGAIRGDLIAFKKAFGTARVSRSRVTSR